MKSFLQALLLIVAATGIAVVANAFAVPTRRLSFPTGFYPDALVVPEQNPVRHPPPPITETAAPTTTASTATIPLAPPVPSATATLPTTTGAATETIAPKTAPPATATATQPVAAPPRAPAADPLTRFQPHPDKAYLEIGGEDAALLHAKGVLFLDARRTAAYEEGHVAGARPFSVWEADLDEKVNALFNERQDVQDQAIVIYCTGGACEDSHMLSQKLWGIQFNNIYVYKDGFPDWQKRRGAVRTGARP